MSSVVLAPRATSTSTDILSGISSGGSGQKTQGITIASFVASLTVGLIIFGVELGVFFLIHSKLNRIYQPRTFLVPERERTKPPPKGLWQWLLPVFKTTNTEFIQKCGLDAYFFLRYLRTLLKIFLPLALLILPILIPLNYHGGRGSAFAVGSYAINNTYTNVTGLDQLAWGNVKPTHNNRYWAHLILGVVAVLWVCFVAFDELRSYIRLRQAYLTSPQHRLRASATTVLVTAIPTKWCTFEALDGLYDVFPGGIRNIWINRDFEDLSDKVKWRNKLALALESAETNLIKKAKQEQLKKSKEDAKKAKKSGKQGHEKRASDSASASDSGVAAAQTDGISSGDPHQTRHTVDDAMDEASPGHSRRQSFDLKKPLPALGQGFEAVGQGLDVFGKSILGGAKKVTKDVDDRINTTGGFVAPPPKQKIDERKGISAGDPGFNFSIPETSPKASLERDHDGSLEANCRGGLHRNIDEAFEDTDHTHSVKDEAHTAGSAERNDEDGLGIIGAPVDSRIDGKMDVSDVMDNPERLGETDVEEKPPFYNFWKRKQRAPFGIPSPVPHGQEEDEFPLSRPSPMTPSCNPQAVVNGKGDGGISQVVNKPKEKIHDVKDKVKGKESQKGHYPAAVNSDYDPDQDDPKWKQYVKEKDRETMRLPIFGWHWMPSLPLIGHKVDTINYCRKEVARLNLEIEEDQKKPEKYPLMNSAFIQFNHQVAAHMACQSVSHHKPNAMAPRVVECSPDDVIWDNMSIKWWESYLRTAAVLTVTAALVVFWAVPVTITGLLSNITYLSKFSWLRWLLRAPTWVLSIIQGVLPQALLAALLALLPVTLRFLARTQGTHTGMATELSVQAYYFAFLFIQVFFVVSISSGITSIIPEIAKSPGDIPALLAENLPRASNYFFSYMLLQALSVSAGALVQIGGLVSWYILAPLLDSTARQKWARQLNLPSMQWGTFFPVYTNLACIGLIYSVISPLMMIFNIITFSLFWLVYRYNTLYVTKFRFDTGGLLYPRAIEQLFTGLYFMELVMIGLFFLVRDVQIGSDGVARSVGTPCKAQAIIMIVVFLLTGIYQYLLGMAFGPLLRYLPITLEDEAVMRDEEFARAQEKRWAMEDEDETAREEAHPVERIDSGRQSPTPQTAANDIELDRLKSTKDYSLLDPRNIGNKVGKLVPLRPSWADRSPRPADGRSPGHQDLASPGLIPLRMHRRHRQMHRPASDTEGQQTGSNALAEALFAGIHDEIEDLTPDERDQLVRRAFQHEALRARRPVIWIPQDDIGVSDDEIRRTQKLSRYVWISNEHTGLDAKGKVIFRRSPPDFSELDLIEL